MRNFRYPALEAHLCHQYQLISQLNAVVEYGNSTRNQSWPGIFHFRIDSDALRHKR
jgi:hypothetical protein